MIISRRQALPDTIARDTHAGLWLDRFLPEQPERDGRGVGEQGTPQKRHLDAATRIAVPGLYTYFYDRWQQGLAASGAVYHTATVQGRMIVGLGDEHVLETAVTLHRTYGVPSIPGSALKGLAASYVRTCLHDSDLAWGQWEHNAQGEAIWKAGWAYTVLFGTTESAGYITFFDALYVPGSGHAGQPLWPDVMTVHHPDYYGNQDRPPADWDNPNPVSFLSATGDYLIALAGPDQWVATAFEILQLALAEMGIGAKTASGYGRLKLEYEQSGEESPDPSVDPHQQAQDAVTPWIGKKVMMNLDREVAGQGYLVRPRPGHAFALAGFLSYALAHGRTPQTGNDMNCVVHGVVQIDGIWYAEVEWPPKQKDKKGKAK